MEAYEHHLSPCEKILLSIFSEYNSTDMYIPLHLDVHPTMFFCIIEISFYHYPAAMGISHYVYIENKTYWHKYETDYSKIHTNTEKVSELYYYKLTVFLCYF